VGAALRLRPEQAAKHDMTASRCGEATCCCASMREGEGPHQHPADGSVALHRSCQRGSLDCALQGALNRERQAQVGLQRLAGVMRATW